VFDFFGVIADRRAKIRRYLLILLNNWDLVIINYRLSELDVFSRERRTP